MFESESTKKGVAVLFSSWMSEEDLTIGEDQEKKVK